jgi:hypothetical protein
MILDTWPELWTGDIEAINAAGDRWIDSGDGTIAEPEVDMYGKVAVIIVDGILTEHGWKQLTSAIEQAAIEPDAKYLLLAICSRAQTWRNCTPAFQALKEARKSLLTTAFIHEACGLAIPLVASCQVVFSHGLGELGYLRGCYPFGKPDSFPTVEATNKSLSNWMLESELQIAPRATAHLAHGIINGEQAEALGVVHWLHPMFDATADFLNKIGAQS